jgi:hypothetical protein
MLEDSRKIQNLDDLREFITEILCDRDQLEVGAFPITERVLVRGGRACGMYFCLHGPRSVKLSAIWDAMNNSVLFYGSSGERFHKACLKQEFELEIMAA